MARPSNKDKALAEMQGHQQKSTPLFDAIEKQTMDDELMALGMRKIKSGANKGMYQAFVVKIRNGVVVEEFGHQPDVKLAASDQMWSDIMERFIGNGEF